MKQILWLEFGSLHTTTRIILPFLIPKTLIKYNALEGSRPNTTRRRGAISRAMQRRVTGSNSSLLRKTVRRQASASL